MYYLKSGSMTLNGSLRRVGDPVPEVASWPEDKLWRCLATKMIEYRHPELGTFPFRAAAEQRPVRQRKAS